MTRILSLIILLFAITPSYGAKILNVYNWADYMPPAVIKQFERETGIHVNYTEYDSNETMYTKLKTNPTIGYDVIVPSTYYVDRMRHEGMLLKLDKRKLSNFHYLNRFLLDQSFDPDNDYSVPFLWGTTAIVINKNHIKPGSVTRWSDFWKPQYKNQLLLFDDMREVFGIALLSLGYSINEKDPKHIEQAYYHLKKLWPNIKLLNLEAEQNIYIDEDAYIGMGLNGEIFNSMAENPNLDYIYPTDGFEVWMDCISIPKHAPHVENALIFINFLLRPDIATKISTALGFSTPNQAAIKLLPQKMRDSPVVNPSNEILNRGQCLMDLGEVNHVYEKYWNRLKIGG